MGNRKKDAKPEYRYFAARNLGFAEVDRRRVYFPGQFNSTESLRAYDDFVAMFFAEKATKQRLKGVSQPDLFETVDPNELTVFGLAARYLTHAKSYYPAGKRGEYANIRHAVLQFIDVLGTVRVGEITAVVLKRWRDSLIRPEISRTYVNSTFSKIRRMFNWGLTEGLVPELIAFGISKIDGVKAGRSIAKEPAKKVVVPDVDFVAVLGEVSPLVADMLQFQRLTGVRSDSLCNARPEQFQPDPADADSLLWYPKHKTEYRGAVVVIPIGPRARAILDRYLKKSRVGQPIFSPRLQRRSGVRRDVRLAYDSHSYAKALKRAINRINRQREADNEGKPKAERVGLMYPWSPHQLRHSRGQEVRNKHGIEYAQAVLGHQSLDSTEIYTTRLLELAKVAAKESG